MSGHERNNESKRCQPCVELTIGNSVFRLSLDELGLPEFSEVVKKSFLPYLSEMVKKLIIQEGRWLILEHKPCCSEIRETGKCDCEPIIDEPCVADEGEQLTCNECGDASTGKLRHHGSLVSDTCGNSWLIWRPVKKDMRYTALESAKFSNILCRNCVNRILTENPEEFSDIFPEREDDPSSNTMH